MSQHEVSGAPGTGTGAPGGAAFPVLEQAATGLRAPWAASLAGMLFALLFTTGIVLLRVTVPTTLNEQSVRDLYTDGHDQPLFIATLYLLPFAGIMYLWFMAVIRDQLGEREDKFFGTVFLGSGLLFVALIFSAAAVAGAPTVGVRYLDLPPPDLEAAESARMLSYTLLFVFATRAAAVCLLSIASLGARSGTFPRWFALTGYLLGASLLLFVNFWDLYLLALPVWVAGVSLFILRRERGRTRCIGPAPADPG